MAKNLKLAGQILSIKGLVVSAKLSGEVRLQLGELLCLEQDREVFAMIHSFPAPDKAVCIFLNPNQKVIKGANLIAVGESVSVPVGEEILGRMFNALGQTIDGGPQLKGLRRKPVSEMDFTVGTGA